MKIVNKYSIVDYPENYIKIDHFSMFCFYLYGFFIRE